MLVKGEGIVESCLPPLSDYPLLRGNRVLAGPGQGVLVPKAASMRA